MYVYVPPALSTSNEPLRSQRKPQASRPVARRQACGQNGSGGVSDALHGTLGRFLPRAFEAAVCRENIQGAEDFGGACAHALGAAS